MHLSTHRPHARLSILPGVILATALALLLALLPTVGTAEAQAAGGTTSITIATGEEFFTIDATNDPVEARLSSGEVYTYPRNLTSYTAELSPPLDGFTRESLTVTVALEQVDYFLTYTFQPADDGPDLVAGNAFGGYQSGTTAFIYDGAPELCTSPAEFEILELEFDSSGEITNLALDFVTSCGNPIDRGSIRLNSTEPLDTMTLISGRVTAAATGAGLGDIQVCAITFEPREYNDDYCVTTNGIGNYTITNLPEDTYVIEFFDPLGRGYAGSCFPTTVGCDNLFGLLKSDFINASSNVDAALEVGCFFSAATDVGTEGDDDLVGSPGDDVFVGYGGNDTITGLGGNDLVCAGFGNDIINLGAGNDAVTAGLGADQINLGDGDNWANAGAGADHIVSGSGADVIYGIGGNDRIESGGGDDVVYGGGGNDVIFAGNGVNTVFGQSGADTLHGGSGEDEMYGGPGYDTLRGYGSSDFLNAGGGNDIIWGGGGSDNLYGKAGDDTIHGEAGADQIFGAGGNDTLIGGQGVDRIQGASGNDRLEGGTGDDVLYGQANNDTMLGNDGNDTLYAAAGNDNLDGGDGNDNLQAGGGNDTLTGGPGNDLLYGQPGTNSLDGGTGTDECFAGGAGSTEANCE